MLQKSLGGPNAPAGSEKGYKHSGVLARLFENVSVEIILKYSQHLLPHCSKSLKNSLVPKRISRLCENCSSAPNFVSSRGRQLSRTLLVTLLPLRWLLRFEGCVMVISMFGRSNLDTSTLEYSCTAQNQHASRTPKEWYRSSIFAKRKQTKFGPIFSSCNLGQSSSVCHPKPNVTGLFIILLNLYMI